MEKQLHRFSEKQFAVGHTEINRRGHNPLKSIEIHDSKVSENLFGKEMA